MRKLGSAPKKLFYGVLLRVAVGRRSVRETGGRRDVGRLVQGKLLLLLLLLLILIVGVVRGRSGECVELLLLHIIACDHKPLPPRSQGRGVAASAVASGGSLEKV